MNKIFKYYVYNNVWNRSKTHTYTKRVYEKTIREEQIIEEVKKSLDYIRENGRIEIRCILDNTGDVIQRSNDSIEFRSPTNIKENEVIIGDIPLNKDLYRERLHRKMNDYSDKVPLYVGTFDNKDRIKVDYSDPNYIRNIITDYCNFCYQLSRIGYSNKKYEYNLALEILDKYSRSGKPLTIKIGNPNEGTPTQVLHNLVSSLCNSYSITADIRMLIYQLSKELKDIFNYGINLKTDGTINPKYSDKFVKEFTILRMTELGLTSKFYFYKRKIFTREEYENLINKVNR